MLNEYIDKPLEVGTVLKEDFDGEINYYIVGEYFVFSNDYDYPEIRPYKFNFNKYSVKVNGLLTEYSMKTKLFVTAYAAAIVAFDQYAQHTLASYANNEFDESPLNDKDLEKANELVTRINVIPTTPVEEDANEE